MRPEQGGWYQGLDVMIIIISVLRRPRNCVWIEGWEYWKKDVLHLLTFEVTVSVANFLSVGHRFKDFQPKFPTLILRLTMTEVSTGWWYIRWHMYADVVRASHPLMLKLGGDPGGPDSAENSLLLMAESLGDTKVRGALVPSLDMEGPWVVTKSTPWELRTAFNPWLTRKWGC